MSKSLEHPLFSSHTFRLHLAAVAAPFAASRRLAYNAKQNLQSLAPISSLLKSSSPVRSLPPLKRHLSIIQTSDISITL